MTSFLFWNLNQKPIQLDVSLLVHQYDVDIVLLAECSISPSLLLKALNHEREVKYHYAPSIGCRRIEIFTKFVSDLIKPISEDSRWTIRHLALPALQDILLAAVHMPSKLHYTESDQKSMCVNLIHDIRTAEARIGHCNTIIVGDLNMNPFEDGVVTADGLHGVVSKAIASQAERIVQNKNYGFFYNPMWNLFGDCTPYPPGTYFYRNSGYKTFFWNMFDQVLVSPKLINRFDVSSLKILTHNSLNNFLLDSGEPNTKDFSDHLPIVFDLEL